MSNNVIEGRPQVFNDMTCGMMLRLRVPLPNITEQYESRMSREAFDLLCEIYHRIDQVLSELDIPDRCFEVEEGCEVYERLSGELAPAIACFKDMRAEQAEALRIKRARDESLRACRMQIRRKRLARLRKAVA